MKRKLVFTVCLCLITALSLGVIAYAAKQTVPAPVAENLEIETTRNTSVNGQLKAVSNTAGPMTFEITTEPNKGIIVLGENGEFVYTPNEGKKGCDYFGYKATDCEGNESAEATVIIRIRKTKTKVCYSDMKGNAAEYAAVVMAERGIFTGEKVGGEYVFNPETEVTRGEFLTMCMSVTGCDVLSGVITTGFSDDAAIPEYQKPYVSTALLTGIISGYSNGLKTAVFNGESGISYAEAAVMLDRALQLTDTTMSLAQAAPEWAAQACANLNACNIIKSGADAYSQCLNRADCAQLLVSAMRVLDAR